MPPVREAVFIYIYIKAQWGFFWHKLGEKFPLKLCLHSGGGRRLWLSNANSSPLASLNVQDGSSVIQTHGTKTLQRDEMQKGGRSIMETYWIRMENVISIFMYVAPVRLCVCVWLRTTLLPAPSPLWQPGLGRLWCDRGSAGLTLWCCGRDAEPVSTNPISITLAASYLWLGWPSALPPSRKSSPLSSALARFPSVAPHPPLQTSLHRPLHLSFSLIVPIFFYYIFCPSLPALQPNRNPMAIILMQHPIKPRQEDARNNAACKKKKIKRCERLYELFRADENAQIALDVKHASRLTAVSAAQTW